MDKETFGQFIQTKRLERGLTLRVYAERIGGMGIGHLCDIENENRPAPENTDLLDKMIAVLKLSPEDEARAYDLASIARNTAVPEDLSGYIKGEDRPYVIRALRTARDAEAGVAEWEEFIRKMEEKRKKND